MKQINKLLRSNKGVSEVVSAMLLIAVAIVAISGIAMMVAEMQKNAAERQSNIDSVEKENLRIMSIATTLNTSEDLEMLRITVTNLNSQDSRVASVLINDRPTDNIASTDEYNSPRNFSFYDRLTIPAGQSREIIMNFSNESNSFANGYNVPAYNTLKVAVFTANANTFTRVFEPPTAIVKTSIETEDLGVAQRDVLVLDASDSFDDGFITGYNWNMGNSTNKTREYSGKKIRIALNQSGPFYVNLTVLDDTSMRGISENVMVPKNDNFNPPVSLSASYSGSVPTGLVEATVKDMYGNPVPGVGVSFITLSGSPSYTPGSVTDSSGKATTTVSAGNGSIQVRSGRMNPVDVQVF